MKSRLNLTIDKALLENMKAYALCKQTSLSEPVEGYFKNLVRPARRKTILDFVDKLPKPDIDTSGDLKEKYYQEQAGKHG